MTSWLVAAGVGLVGLLLWLWEKASHADTKSRLHKESVNHLKTREDLSTQVAECIRLGTAVGVLRSEATRLNDELASCIIPGNARDRLNRLLARARTTAL